MTIPLLLEKGRVWVLMGRPGNLGALPGFSPAILVLARASFWRALYNTS